MTITDLYSLLFGKGAIQDGDVISMAEHGRAGGVSTGQGFKFTDSVKQTVKITESGNYTYIAKAKIGTDQSSASWQVLRIDETTGTIILWADGNENFDNIATDLTSLTYS